MTLCPLLLIQMDSFNHLVVLCASLSMTLAYPTLSRDWMQRRVLLYHVLNSKQLAEEMANITVEDFEIMNSHDVISLFTKTPIEQTLRIIRSRLEQDRDLKNRTQTHSE